MFIYHFNRMIRSRVLWLVFAVIVGASFLALPSCFSGGMGGNEYVGRLGKEKITQDEYTRAQIFVDRVMRPADQTPAAVETQVWAHIAAMRTAKELGIVASSEELRSILLSQEAFQNEGAFDPDLYSRIVEQQLGLTAAGYERLLADQVVLSKLMAAVAAGYNASPMEIDDEVAARTDKITFQYASVSNAFLTSEIEATDDDVLAYYEENKADYALPDRVAVRYATLAVTNFVPFVVIDDVDVEDYYDANPSLYSRSTTNGVETIPLDEESRKICAAVLEDRLAANSMQKLFPAKDHAQIGRSLTKVGKLIRDDLELSCPEIDWLIKRALEVPGCYGASLAFNGDNIYIALLMGEAARSLYDVKLEDYERIFGFKARMTDLEPFGNWEILAVR